MSKKKSAPTSIGGVKVVTDSGWEMNQKSSIPGRGIRDYDRTIKFDRPLSSEEMKHVKSWLQNNNCPGWTPITAGRKLDELSTYIFSTTFDSSD